MDTWDSEAWRDAGEHGLDADEIQRRKAALGLTGRELAAVVTLHRKVLTPQPGAFQALIAHLATGSVSHPKRLQTALTELFSQMAAGDYGQKQALQRIYTGVVLRRAGLTLPGLLGCYGSYLSQALAAIPQSDSETAAALCKTVLLDMGLVLHGYDPPSAAPGLSAATTGPTLAAGKETRKGIGTRQQPAHPAYHDSLTELPNRRLLINLLDQALKRAHRHQRVVAVLQIDLDDFRQISNNVGHQTGDALLQRLAQRLVGNLRGNDIVARLHEDTFAIVLEDIGANSDVSRVVNKVLRCLSGGLELEGRQYLLTISTGISLFPLDSQDPQNLLKRAGLALQQAKSRGGNTYQYYSRDLDTDAFYRHTLARFTQALEHNEFELHYQCLVGVGDLRIDAVEALLRWRHPERGLLQPRSFLGLLEDNGLIVPVGRWVLQQACTQAVAWRQAGHRFAAVTVNLSGQQFRDPELIPTVQRVLKESGLAPEHLELEIPEAVLTKSLHLSIQTLRGLRELGIRLAVDDFGTAHASLPNLLRLPLNTLKIDHRFVRDIGVSEADEALVGSAIAMAHGLGYKTVAEGVETEAQLAFLRERGCDVFQGFHHSQPLDPARLAMLLEHTDVTISLPLH